MSNLEYVGAVDIESGLVSDKLKMENLKGFAAGAPDGGYIKYDGVKLDEIQYLFDHPMQPASDDAWPSIYIRHDGSQQIVINWPKVNHLHLEDALGLDTMGVILGRANMAMEIRDLRFINGVSNFEKGMGIKKLSVGYFEIKRALIERLYLVFDELTELVIADGRELNEIVFPKAAGTWNNLSIRAENKCCYDLDLTAYDGWNWPKQMRELYPGRDL